jgi:hypothetical protein
MPCSKLVLANLEHWSAVAASGAVILTLMSQRMGLAVFVVSGVVWVFFPLLDAQLIRTSVLLPVLHSMRSLNASKQTMNFPSMRSAGATPVAEKEQELKERWAR